MNKKKGQEIMNRMMDGAPYVEISWRLPQVFASRFFAFVYSVGNEGIGTKGYWLCWIFVGPTR
jgi:hypothetical protein